MSAGKKGGESSLLEDSGEEYGSNAADTKRIIVNADVEHAQLKINKWRVREGATITPNQIILLYHAIEETQAASVSPALAKVLHKVRSTCGGVVMKLLYKEGEIIKRGVPVMELTECKHTMIVKDMCAECGADLRKNNHGKVSEASVPVVHAIPDLKVTQKVAQKMGHADTERLLTTRKLALLVDLDQTVIHTTNDNVPNNIRGIYHFQLYGPQAPWYHTRLRPGTKEFLERMSELFELHICTFGARNYAHMIARLLDPDGKLFDNRILSRDECFNATSKKDNLKALFPNGDSMVCIIDDREDVWNMASNLIQVKPYHFFQHTGDINAPPGLRKCELDGEGVNFKEVVDKSSEECSGDKIAEDNPNGDENTKLDPETSVSDNAESENKSQSSKNEEPVSENKTDSKENDTKADISVSNEAPQICEKSESKAETEEVVQNSCSLNDRDEHITVDDESAPDGAVADVGSNEFSNSNDASTSRPKLPNDQKLGEIDIEDGDDYLLYLETILRNIHERFYTYYDESNKDGKHKAVIPDLKQIVPQIRSEVLPGVHIVFSGLVPTDQPLQQSRAYFIAKSLGAQVTPEINDDTTHLVAINSGTLKVNLAKKNKKIAIVNANWLWTCAERWERVDEKLYPLDRNARSKNRLPPAHCHSPQHVVDYHGKVDLSPPSPSTTADSPGGAENFKNSLNAWLTLGEDDLNAMHNEVDQESTSSDDDGPVDIENPPLDKNLRKRKRCDESNVRRKSFFSRRDNTLFDHINRDVQQHDSDFQLSDSSDEESDDPLTKFKRGEVPSDLDQRSDDSSSDDNDPNSDDDEMGAAIERELFN